MKRIILNLALATTVSAGGVLTSCNEKPRTVAKTESKTEVTKTDTVETTPVDTTAKTSTDTTATAETTSTETSTKEGGISQKFGHINSADLVDMMPEKKKADASLQAYVRSLEGKLGSLQNDYRKKITDYQTNERTMIDAIKETKIKDIQNLEMQMQQSQAEGQEKIAQKREALYKPILDKAEKAIKDVGKENGYDYIFDTNAGSFIYSKDSHDVMPLVKKKLGLK